MGITAENVADKWKLTREELDTFAFESQQKAENAIKAGRFKDEIVPVEMSGKKGVTVFDTDEHPRRDVSRESLAKLKPAFDKNGTVTAGNSSGLNDGAAALVVASAKKAKEIGAKPLVRLIASAIAGVDPRLMGYGPVPAVQMLLKKTGMKLDDIGLIEANEAFAAQYLACEKGLGLDRTKVNVNGSGVGLGHPVGCTGARLIVTLMNEMKRRNVRHGIATLCVGGGMGAAVLIENI